jgi:hypothetical protein
LIRIILHSVYKPEVALRVAARGRAGEAVKADAAATQAARMVACIGVSKSSVLQVVNSPILPRTIQVPILINAFDEKPANSDKRML